MFAQGCEDGTPASSDGLAWIHFDREAPSLEDQETQPRLFETGITGGGTANASVRAQVGYGPASKNPEYEAGWTWIAGRTWTAA